MSKQSCIVDNAVRDICSIETVQFASKDRVRKIVERVRAEALKEAGEAVAKYDCGDTEQCTHFCGQRSKLILAEIDKLIEGTKRKTGI